jgi:hypothetical protein
LGWITLIVVVAYLLIGNYPLVLGERPADECAKRIAGTSHQPGYSDGCTRLPMAIQCCLIFDQDFGGGLQPLITPEVGELLT